MLSLCEIRAVVMPCRVVPRRFIGILFSAVVSLLVCGSVSAQTPTLVHSLSSASPSAAGRASEPGNAFQIQFTGSMGTGTLAGNLLVLKITYPSGSTVSSIADNKSSTYTPGPTVTSGTGWTTQLYYTANTAAGVNVITVTFAAAVGDFHFSAQEYSGVATSSPADGSCTGSGASAVSCSSAITTTGNGDLIVSSAIDAQNNSYLCGDASTAITPGGSFFLDAADPYCSYGDAEYTQPSSGAITPSFTFTGNRDTFNIVAMAFKAAAAGTNPTGMNIRHLEKVVLNLGASSQSYYFVSSGNLIVATTDVGGDSDSVTLGGCTSGPASPWTKRVPTTGNTSDEPQIFFIPNAATSTNLECTATMSNSGNVGMLAIYDIAGAATSPEDVDSPGVANGGTSLTDFPSVTPTTAPGIAFVALNTGIGPITAAPGGLFDNTPYTGETDSGMLNNGDAWQHQFYASTSALNFAWTQANSGSYAQAFAVSFKSAPVVLNADLGVTQSASPSSVLAGSNVTYTLTVTNEGPSSASSVVVTDNLAAQTSYVSCSSTAGSCSVTGNSVTVNIGTLANGASATVTLAASVNSATADGTTITNSASVSSAAPDPNSGNNTATATTTVSNPTDLSITDTVSPNPVVAGSNATFTLVVTNSGSATAQEVVVSESLPLGTTFVSCSAPTGWSCTNSSGNVTASVATLSSDASATIIVVAFVNASMANGAVISDAASVSGTNSDPKTSNNSASASDSVQNVPKIAPTVTWTPPAAVTFGTALGSTQLDATASVTGSFSYTPATGTVLGAGSQTLSVYFTPTDTADYSSATASVTLQVNKAAPAITWPTPPTAITYGTALSSTQLDATASVAGSFSYTPAAGTVLGAGSQTLSVTFTPTDTTDYSSATASVTLQVNKSSLTITWPPPAAIPFGTALSSTQLDATASVAGSFAYTPGAGTVLGAGSQTLSVSFTPTDTTDYSSATASVALQVNKSAPTITWPPPTAIPSGTALSSTQLDATASVAGSFAYTPAAGTVLGIGSHTLSVAFTPADTTDYSSAAASVTLQVNKAAPTITWPTPNAITYGAALGSIQLDATASVAGSFAYTPGAGTVLGAGSHTLSVTFTPTDTTDYSSATASVALQVNKAAPTINWPTPAAITYGTALSSRQLDATASVAGSFSYTPVTGTVLGAGSQTLSVNFTPSNTSNYSSATASVTLQINKATPRITWPTPRSITYGTALSSSQLDATASVHGTLVYNPAAGTVLSAGSQTLSVTFTPADNTDYNSVTATVTLQINQARGRFQGAQVGLHR
jgi:uncharacterized repeat protein (TIGR01451 family)